MTIPINQPIYAFFLAHLISWECKGGPPQCYPEPQEIAGLNIDLANLWFICCPFELIVGFERCNSLAGHLGFAEVFFGKKKWKGQIRSNKWDEFLHKLLVIRIFKKIIHIQRAEKMFVDTCARVQIPMVLLVVGD